MESAPTPSEQPPISSKHFRGVGHDCPSCGLKISRSTRRCSRCQCNLETLNTLLGKEGPPLTTIMDLAGLLKEDRINVENAIALNELKFPQLKLLYCSVRCPEGTKPTTLGWWMLNQGVHSASPSWTGLLLVDPRSHLVTFQTGYDLEVFINRQKLEALLSECGEWFTLGQWSGGISNFFNELYEILKQSHRNAIITRKEALRATRKE